LARVAGLLAIASVGAGQGNEFVSRDLDLWAYQRGVALDSGPIKPTDNAFIEVERLNTRWFLSLADTSKR
jgi:putative transposase